MEDGGEHVAIEHDAVRRLGDAPLAVVLLGEAEGELRDAVVGLVRAVLVDGRDRWTSERSTAPSLVATGSRSSGRSIVTLAAGFQVSRSSSARNIRATPQFAAGRDRIRPG